MQRIIARLDCKNNFLVKGISLEGLRVIGNPKTFANEYLSLIHISEPTRPY